MAGFGFKLGGGGGAGPKSERTPLQRVLYWGAVLAVWGAIFLVVFFAVFARDLPDTIVREIQTQFLVPQAAIKVWHVNGIFSMEDFSTGVSEDTQTFASSLSTPYCGVNSGFEAVGWLPDPAQALSVALRDLADFTLAASLG